MPDTTTPCTYCETPTRMLGTKLCDPCWQLRAALMYRSPDVVARALAAVSGSLERTIAVRDALTAAIDAPR